MENINIVPSCLYRRQKGGKFRDFNPEAMEKSLTCKRMTRFKEMLTEDPLYRNKEEFNNLLSNLPSVAWQMKLNQDGLTMWNGRFLFSTNDVEFGLRVVDNHAQELNIVAAFREPTYDRLYFVIDTGVKRVPWEHSKCLRDQWLMQLHKYFTHVAVYPVGFFNRVVPEEFMVYLDTGSIFYNQRPEPLDAPQCITETSETCVSEHPSSNSPTNSDSSLSKSVKTFVSRLWQH